MGLKINRGVQGTFKQRLQKSTKKAARKLEDKLDLTERTHLVKSSNLKAVTYDRDLKDLTITFKKGNRVYTYFDVPYSIYQRLMIAPSQGEYFAEIIKPRFSYVEGTGNSKNRTTKAKGGSR